MNLQVKEEQVDGQIDAGRRRGTSVAQFEADAYEEDD